MNDYSAALPAELLDSAAAESSVATAAGRPLERLRFTGEGGEYFRIWIVNLLFTVLTLGVYSAWAKVRRERWFLRNTRLENSPFDYHGRPMAILKGRVLVVVVIVILDVLAKIHPIMSAVTSIAFLVALPWIITRAMRFRAANTSWRGLRFGFAGSIREAVHVFIFLPVLMVFTLGLIYPYIVARQKEYVFNNLAYGNVSFELQLPIGAVYGIYFRAGGLLLMGIVGLGVLAAMKLPVAGAIVLWLAVLGTIPLARAAMTNLVAAHLALGLHRFEGDQKIGELYAIWFKNLLLTVLTLGLYRPFAAVNLWRYRMEHLSVLPGASLAAFVAGQREQVQVLGEEAGDLLDVDLGV